jgi:hypothetical protein
MMLYKFVARAYRIDRSVPAKIPLGTLQQSQTGGLLGTASDNWTDLAYGFTDLQVALQIYDNDATDTDGDGDPAREWYSSQAQQVLTRTQIPPVVPPLAVPLQMSISLVARTDRDVEGIATLQTPELTEVALVPMVPRPWAACCTRANNPIGDRPAIPLPSADPALTGTKIYRYVTFEVDFRNLGVGR